MSSVVCMEHLFSISLIDIPETWARLIPNILRNWHIDFHGGCTSVHSHQQWIRASLTPHPHQHELASILLIWVILTGVRWNLKVILICMSLMAKDVSQPFVSFFLILCLNMCLMFNRFICFLDIQVFSDLFEFWILVLHWMYRW